MTPPKRPAFACMPPRARLEMRAQELRSKPQPQTTAQQPSKSSVFWRAALFLPALSATWLMLDGMHHWFSDMGLSGMEWLILSMIGFTFVWVSLSVSTIGLATAGLLARARDREGETSDGPSLSVALVLPIFNEPTSDVFGNAAAMLDDISARASRHTYTLFILSDTNDENVARAEEQAFYALRDATPLGVEVFYRRRAENTDKKVGNLVDWIAGWGGAHEAMVVLDADSLMSARAIDALADEMSRNTNVGLIQTCPVLIGAETMFARVQQFSNITYGWLLAEGLARWSRSEGNYWGHNAIIRTRAFASSAGLPHLSGRKGRKKLILSHDFVEAGLLRRAGWQVRFMPRISGSFEETPSTLVDYVQRDQRWCRGNLQHLRLLGTAGLHPVSRYHLLHGAVSYLLSPAWFLLLVFWFLLGKDQDTNVIRYFNEANPLFPDWPPAMSHIDSAVFLVIMYAMLLAPKLVSAMLIAFHPKASRLYGGRGSFLSAFVVEVLLSIAYAPILMVQQTRAVWRALVGKPLTWSAQRRHATTYPVLALLRFHWMETVMGIILFAGLGSGLVSWWLLPIALSLVLTVPLSAVSSWPVAKCLPQPLRMESPHTIREPAIVLKAKERRVAFADALGAAPVAAA